MISAFVFWLAAIGLSGCATRVHEDYGQYLQNNQGKADYVTVADSVQYYLDPKTERHTKEIRAFMTGIANSWEVRFGDVLDATMQSHDMKTAFGQVSKVPAPDGSQGLVLAFSLVRYEFSDFQASIALNTIARSDGRKVLERTYQATGISQGGKMFWGGAFAMKNAVQQSTKDALDTIFAKFISDLSVSIATPRIRTAKKMSPWPGNWFGTNGPYQIYLVIHNDSVSGRIRTASGYVHSIVGSIGAEGQLGARFDGDAQAPKLELIGTMPALALYNNGELVGNLRMDRRN